MYINDMSDVKFRLRTLRPICRAVRVCIDSRATSVLRAYHFWLHFSQS